jgi:MFS family permease
MSIVGAIIADFSPEDKRGIYMGFSGFMQTLGNGLGFFFGMWFLTLLPDAHKEFIWLIFAAVGLVTCVGYIPFSKMIGDRDKPTKHAGPIMYTVDEMIPGKLLEK